MALGERSLIQLTSEPAVVSCNCAGSELGSAHIPHGAGGHFSLCGLFLPAYVTSCSCGSTGRVSPSLPGHGRRLVTLVLGAHNI